MQRTTQWMKLGLLALCALGMNAMKASAASGTVTVAPQGEFAQIDTRATNEIVRALAEGSAEEKQAAIAKIRKHPENYAPPALYLLSNVLFSEGEKEEAMFWFYAGQLRARVDSSICADPTAGQAVGVLNSEYGQPINQYAFQDIPKLEALIPKVVAWERKTPYRYDRRWINLHGMGAVMSGLGAKDDAPKAALSLPNAQWNDIAEKTRSDYLSGFMQAMARLKSNQ